MSVMGEYQKYCQTRNELYFEKLYYKMQYLIRWKIRAFGIGGTDVEDVKQEVFQELYKAAERYNPELKNEIGFCMMIIDRAIMGYLTAKNRKKHRYLNEAYSLDREIENEREDDGVECYDRTASSYNLENEIIAREEIREYYSKIKNSLTEIELKVWQADIITKSSDKKSSNYEAIKEITGYETKRIDNTLQRIKAKIRKIKNGKEIKCRQRSW